MVDSKPSSVMKVSDIIHLASMMLIKKRRYVPVVEDF